MMSFRAVRSCRITSSRVRSGSCASVCGSGSCRSVIGAQGYWIELLIANAQASLRAPRAAEAAGAARSVVERLSERELALDERRDDELRDAVAARDRERL